MNNSKIKNKLIDAGVKHLQEYGYPKCNSENIITDKIYAAFFKNMLEGTLEDLEPTDVAHAEVKNLLDEINA